MYDCIQTLQTRHGVPCWVWRSCILISSMWLVIHCDLSSHSINWALSCAHRSTCRKQDIARDVIDSTQYNHPWVAGLHAISPQGETKLWEKGRAASFPTLSRRLWSDWPHSGAVPGAPASGCGTLPHPDCGRSAASGAPSARTAAPWTACPNLREGLLELRTSFEKIHPFNLPVQCPYQWERHLRGGGEASGDTQEPI